MSHNLQSRSFSIDTISASAIKPAGSVGSKSTDPIAGEIGHSGSTSGSNSIAGAAAPLKVNTFRSASIGSSSFFPHKEASHFFKNPVSLNSVSADDLDNPQDESATKDEDLEALKSSNLDIVGAIGNLDLDEDFSIPNESLEKGSSDGKATPDGVADPNVVLSDSAAVSTTGVSDSPFQPSHHPHFLPVDPHGAPQMYPSHEFVPNGVTMSPNQSIGGQFSAFSTSVTPTSSSWKHLHGIYPPSASGIVGRDQSESQSNDFGINIQHLKLDNPEAPSDTNDSNLKVKSGQATSALAGSGPKSALQSPNIPDNYLGFTTPPPVGFVHQRGTPNQFLNEGSFFGESIDMNNYMNGAGHMAGYPAPVPHQAFSHDANGKPNNYQMAPLADNMLWQQRLGQTSIPSQLNHPMLSRNNTGGGNSTLGGNNNSGSRNMNAPIQGSGPGNNHYGGGRFARSNTNHYGNEGPGNNMNPSINNNSGNNFNNNHGHHHHSHGNHGMRRNDMNSHRKMNNRRKGDDASKYVNARLEDFTGEIYSLCKDQHGCRFLQRQLDLGNDIGQGVIADSSGQVLTKEVAATMIFNEIYLKIIELMVDPFGNYLIQKLFENISPAQRTILVKNASPEFIRIALDPHGTRALQKLVECIDTKEESKLIIESLSPHIVTLSRDLNGNHVVQKCLQKLTPEDNQFIFETASMHCNEIATHRHGCCVLQRCLDHGNPEQRKQLSLKVAENATSLSLDPFGNYVVQYVLSRGDEKSITIILDHIRANVIKLLLHKFGSNVIEKSLRINKLTESLIAVLLENSDKFSDLLNDAYGNYVLQTSLDVANGRDLAKLASALQPLLINIKNTPHGRRILTKIQNVC